MRFVLMYSLLLSSGLSTVTELALLTEQNDELMTSTKLWSIKNALIFFSLDEFNLVDISLSLIC